MQRSPSGKVDVVSASSEIPCILHKKNIRYCYFNVCNVQCVFVTAYTVPCWC